MTTAIGERVILLTGTDAVIERIPLSAADIGQVRYFKAPSSGQTLEEAPAIPVTISGNSLKPYAPVNLAATVDNVGNITITWDRRDRHAGERTDYANFPLSEAKQEWEIDVLAEATVVRTIRSFDNKTVYSVTDQMGDFGSVQSSVTVTVYQISIDVGRGYPATATLTPTFQEATPVITGFNPMSGAEGDTIALYGSGLAGVTALNVAGVPATNIAVISDNEISFAIAPDTVSGLIAVTTLGGTANSSNSLIVNARQNSGFTGVAIPGTFGELALTTQLLADGDSENFDLNIGAFSSIRKITSSINSRIRLFGSDADRVADTAPVTSQLSEQSGLVLDRLINGSYLFAQGIIAQNFDTSLTNKIYLKIFNDSGAANAIDFEMEYFTLAKAIKPELILAQDSFVDSDNSLLINHNLDIGSSSWIDARQRSYGLPADNRIINNKLVLNFNNTGAVVDIGQLNSLITVDWEIPTTSSRNSLVTRYVEDGTMLNFNFRYDNGDIRFVSFLNDNLTVLAETSYNFQLGNSYKIALLANGENYVAYINDVAVLSLATNLHNNGTAVGVFRNNGNSNTYFDNFVVKDVD